MPRKKTVATPVADTPLACDEPMRPPLPELPAPPPGEVLVAARFGESHEASFVVVSPALREAIAPLVDAIGGSRDGCYGFRRELWEQLFMEYHHDLLGDGCWVPTRDFNSGAEWFFEKRGTLDEHSDCIYAGVVALLLTHHEVVLHGDAPPHVEWGDELAESLQQRCEAQWEDGAIGTPSLHGWATMPRSVLDLLTEGVSELAPRIHERRTNPSTDVYQIDGSDTGTLEWCDSRYAEVAYTISDARERIAELELDGLELDDDLVEARLTRHLAKLKDSARLEAALAIHRRGESGDSVAMGLPGVGGGTSFTMGGGACGLGWRFTVARVTRRDRLISTGPGYDYRDALVETVADLEVLAGLACYTQDIYEAPADDPEQVEEALGELQAALPEKQRLWQNGLWLAALPADVAPGSIDRRIAEVILAAAKDAKTLARDRREVERRLRRADRDAARRGRAS